MEKRNHEARAEKTGGKKKYSKPRLTVHGDITRLTQSAAGTMSDGYMLRTATS